MTVTQTVSVPGGDASSMTINIIAMHVATDSPHTVRFFDGGTLIDTQRITNETVVQHGDDHIILPLVEKDGYRFSGWYLSDYKTEFDPTRPLTADTDVYAKWTYASAGGGQGSQGSQGGQEVINGIHVVTFNVSPGIEHVVGDVGGSSMSFSVGLVGGYELRGDILVTATGGTITEVLDGQYILSGIDGDIVVSIMGDTYVIYGDMPGVVEPEGESVPVYTWAVLAVVIAAIAVAAFLVLRGRS